MQLLIKFKQWILLLKMVNLTKITDTKPSTKDKKPKNNVKHVTHAFLQEKYLEKMVNIPEQGLRVDMSILFRKNCPLVPF